MAEGRTVIRLLRVDDPSERRTLARWASFLYETAAYVQELDPDHWALEALARQEVGGHEDDVVTERMTGDAMRFYTHQKWDSSSNSFERLLQFVVSART